MQSKILFFPFSAVLPTHSEGRSSGQGDLIACFGHHGLVSFTHLRLKKNLLLCFSLVNDTMDRIATEATRIASDERRKTITLHDLEFAVRQCLPEEMAKRANQRAQQLVAKTISTKMLMTKFNAAKSLDPKVVAHKIASTIISEKSLNNISDDKLVQLMELGMQVLDDVSLGGGLCGLDCMAIGILRFFGPLSGTGARCCASSVLRFRRHSWQLVGLSQVGCRRRAAVF